MMGPSWKKRVLRPRPMAVVAASTLTALLLGPPWSSAQQAPAALSARPVQFRASAPLPDTIPFDKKPFAHDTGFEMFYLVEGRDLAGLKEDSLQVSSLRARDGSDVSLTRTGVSPVSLGSFPAATEDGRHLIFSVRSEQDLFDRVDQRSLRGSVVVYVGSRRETAEVTLTPTSGAQTLGPFQVRLVPGVTSGESGVTVTGSLPALINVLQIRGGSAVTADQISSGGFEKTFHFPAGADPSPRIRLNYWGDLAERTVSFGP